MRGDRACSYPNHLLSIPTASVVSQRDSLDRVYPLRDMELLHYWTCHSYMSCTDDASQYTIWQVVMPRLSFSYQFLLHGMLALTALHRHYEMGDDEQAEGLTDLARYHQQHALTLYIPLIPKLDEHNCHALFAFSIILGALSFAMLHNQHDEDLPSSGSQGIVKRFIDAFDAFLGATAVGIHAHDWLLRGPMASYMSPLEPTVQKLDLPDVPFQLALETLLGYVSGMTQKSDDKDVAAKSVTYIQSIMGLGTILSQDPDRLRISYLVAWPVMAENAYISLLKEGDPFALVILGHYGVALHMHGNRLWMLETLGARLTLAIYAELDDEWRPHLDWAKSRVDDPMPSHVIGTDSVSSHSVSGG